MTESPHSPPLQFENIEQVFTLMRDRGHRVSMPARLVLETLFDAEGPISVKHITRQAPLADFDASSIYRNLERLEKLGVVQHVHLGHGPGLYMLVGSGEKEFLICERCDRVMSVDPEELDSVRDQIRKTSGYEAHFTHFPIVGLCPECAGSRVLGTQTHSHGEFVHSHPHSRGEGHSHPGSRTSGGH